MNESFQTVEKMLKAIVRRLSVNSVNRYRDHGRPSFNEPKHPRVCYLINDVNGRHPHFRRFERILWCFTRNLFTLYFCTDKMSYLQYELSVF